MAHTDNELARSTPVGDVIETVGVASSGGFINVDLEIGARTRARLEPLIEQFEKTLFVMYVGRIRSLYHAHYESQGRSSIRRKGQSGPTPSAVIHELADEIERLDHAGRRAWNAASIRDFNVGIEIPPGVWSVEHGIDADAIRRIAALRGRVVFTTYQLAALSQRRRTVLTASSSPRRRPRS